MTARTHNHHVHANEDGYDLGFIEAAHSQREADYQPGSLAQVPLGGGTSVEVYAPKDVPVLAYPVLYCQTHNTEHPCKYQHVSERLSDMGDCADGLYASRYAPDLYREAQRVPTTVSRTYTGRMERKA